MDSCAKDESNSLYFGYGSNLWQDQMKRRCSESQYVGIARLEAFRWIINERGYANVVSHPKLAGSLADNAVYGLVYRLSEKDEELLDGNEGVPWAYTKETMTSKFWPAGATAGPSESKEVLVYIDRKRTVGGHRPKEEYIHRMNMGIRDALHEGVPQSYVDKVLREYIPDGDVDDAVRLVAERQARHFVDSTTPRS